MNTPVVLITGALSRASDVRLPWRSRKKARPSLFQVAATKKAQSYAELHKLGVEAEFLRSPRGRCAQPHR
jgi:hypothetical protein